MASPGSQSKDRQQNATRDSHTGQSKGTAGGSSGRPGGVGSVGQVNSKPTTTSYGAPIHYDNSSNPVSGGMTFAASPALNQKNVARTNMYNDAARAWNESASKRSLGNFVNALSPG